MVGVELKMQALVQADADSVSRMPSAWRSSAISGVSVE